jgi:hypothetical protein
VGRINKNLRDSLVWLANVTVASHDMSYGVGIVITHFNNIPLITVADIPRILFTDCFFMNCVIKQCIGEKRVLKLF